MKKQIEQELINIVQEIYQIETKVILTFPKDKKNGDISSNVALTLSKPLSKKPQIIAQELIDKFLAKPESNNWVSKIEVAGPGFINFFLVDNDIEIIKKILTLKNSFGTNPSGKNQKVLVEMVSANPTGPLHIGHGRGACYGDVIANFLKANGYQVEKEYYVNDFGRQIKILALSVWLRFLQNSHRFNFPQNAYQGDYISQFAQDFFKSDFATYQMQSIESVNFILQKQEIDDEQIDTLISWMIDSLTQEDYKKMSSAIIEFMLDKIKSNLNHLGVKIDNWFYESNLYDTQDIQKFIENLDTKGLIYQKDGASWFKATEFGDEKDRVIQRTNQDYTYFASDIGYHFNKYNRGFARMINVWGADHHGYIPRVKACINALGNDENKLEISLIQMVGLMEGGNKSSMSTRKGTYVDLDELIENIGSECTRFFYLTRKYNQQMDIDLDLAKQHNKDNPFYYINYAHARICTLMNKLGEKDKKILTEFDYNQIELKDEASKKLIHKLIQYEELVLQLSQNLEPNHLVNYLRDLANDFHSFYHSEPILTAEPTQKFSKLILIKAIAQTLKNALALIGVKALEKM